MIIYGYHIACFFKINAATYHMLENDMDDLITQYTIKLHDIKSDPAEISELFLELLRIAINCLEPDNETAASILDSLIYSSSELMDHFSKP